MHLDGGRAVDVLFELELQGGEWRSLVSAPVSGAGGRRFKSSLPDGGFKVKCREVAQPGSASAWGAGGRRFKSSLPDSVVVLL